MNYFSKLVNTDDIWEVRVHLETCGGDKTDWKSVRSMKDEDIVYDDHSPEITENMFGKMKWLGRLARPTRDFKWPWNSSRT